MKRITQEKRRPTDIVKNSEQNSLNYHYIEPHQKKYNENKPQVTRRT